MFFTYFNVNTGMVWLYVDKIYLHIHVVYILWLKKLFVFYLMYHLYLISFLSLSDNSSLEANVICLL